VVPIDGTYGRNRITACFLVRSEDTAVKINFPPIRVDLDNEPRRDILAIVLLGEIMAPVIRIHHLSDIHIGPAHYSASRKLRFLNQDHDNAWSNVAHYIRYLKRLNDREPDRLPDIVILSGDLTSVGDRKEFDCAQDRIKEIVAHVQKKEQNWRRADQPCIFLVPGNHDMDWSQPTYAQRIEGYARLSDNLCATGNVVSAVSHSKSHPTFYDYGDKSNLLIYLFSSCSLGGTTDPSLDQAISALQSARRQLAEVGDGQDEFETAIENLMDATRQDPGYVDLDEHSEIHNVLGPETNGRLKIGVVHHNPVAVPSNDMESFDTIINAGKFKDLLIEQGFDLILHGHRHFEHCTYEEYLRKLHEQECANPYQQGLYVLSADSLGCKHEAPFYEMIVEDGLEAHKVKPPSSVITVSSASRSGDNYYSTKQTYRLLVDKPTTANLRLIQERLDRGVQTNREHLQTAFENVGPSFRRLQAEVDDWGDSKENGGSTWYRVFQSYLPRFSFIAVTDSLGPGGWLNARYLQHAAVQFRHRRSRDSSTSNELYFSPEVFAAIEKVKWDPDRDALPTDSRTEVKERSNLNDGRLEIVRLLFWTEDQLAEKPIVDMVDYYHTMFGVPIFVLPREKLKSTPGGFAEFLLGVDHQKDVHIGYALKRFEMTEQLEAEEGSKLLDFFEKLLKDDDLKSLQDYRS